MRKSKEAAAESRARILATAARLFRAHGPQAVSVADIMEAAGMTHGGFYKHFASKDALLAEAITAMFEEKRPMFARPTAAEAGAALADYAAEYLSTGHIGNLEAGCPIAGLSLDAQRAGPDVRRSFAGAIEAMIADIALAKGTGPEAESEALRDIMTMLGAIVLARSVEDQALQERILDTARKARTDIG